MFLGAESVDVKLGDEIGETSDGIAHEQRIINRAKVNINDNRIFICSFDGNSVGAKGLEPVTSSV